MVTLSTIGLFPLLLALAIVLTIALSSGPVGAAPHERTSSVTMLAQKHHGQLLHRWDDQRVSPQAILIALHGMSLDGESYEALAKLLVPEGFIVLAPDLRGFGHWYFTDGTCKSQPAVDYELAFKDLEEVLQQAHQAHPTLPIFLAGESIGAPLALRLAYQHSDLVDGLILSGPPAKRCQYISPRMLASVAFGLVAPRHEFDLSPYVHKYVSEDPKIVEERLRDPLRRNRLSLSQLLKSDRISKQTLKFAKTIDQEIPVLILQGEKDRVVLPEAAFTLFRQLPSTDKSLRVFPDRGHILLETAYLRPEVTRALSNWLMKHTSAQTAYTQSKLTASSHPQN